MKGLSFWGGVLLLMVCEGCSRPQVEHLKWPVMGTVASVQWRGEKPADGVSRVREMFAEVTRLLNAHDPQSELCRLAPLSDAEILAQCTPLVRPCYEAAFRLCRESGGAFNPRWRGTNQLDLGAIAKGFAVDLAAATVTGDTLIDLGGNLKASGGAWQVGVYEPEQRQGKQQEVFTLRAGEACATSGEYWRGKHIYDARTGCAVSNAVVSVTVIHPTSALLADGLSTILFILGREKGEFFLRKYYPEARALWVMQP